MRYVGKAVESAFFPKLMGTYEKELHGIWYRQIAAASSRWVVNIGAAEGYYAVGLLFSKATTTIICFEESAVGQSLIRALAAKNGITAGLEVRGRCDSAALRACLAQSGVPAFVLCDIEGGELDVLTIEQVPQLARCEMLVEVHESVLPGIGTTLVDRFGATHQASKHLPQLRVESDLPNHSSYWRILPTGYALGLMDELRSPIDYWLHFVPRGGK
ncbi:MAG: hypothetical protein A3G75_08210 [Verrucomicrobia bacterium RIFCSPLOWO2_12_FULL_64_8]|nr:MAG: hypothetical protein A3G75_08210 [Verrucomicrobia bacterium RIFCSPLOWO2_12_FULL_64_8]